MWFGWRHCTCTFSQQVYCFRQVWSEQSLTQMISGVHNLVVLWPTRVLSKNRCSISGPSRASLLWDDLKRITKCGKFHGLHTAHGLSTNRWSIYDRCGWSRPPSTGLQAYDYLVLNPTLSRGKLPDT